MNPHAISHQTIGPATPAAAAAALGGVPTRPPAPVAPDRESIAQADARQAFKDANTETPPPAPVLIGHPTFDPAPDALGLRREKVSIVRLRLAALARQILAENAALQPLISELDAEAEAVLTGELFNPAIARSVLASLSQTVMALAEEKAEKLKS